MKLMPVLYLGHTSMDRRFSSPMLPWVVAEIRKSDSYEQLSLGVEDGFLQAYNVDFELQFCHRLSQMMRFSQADMDPCTFLYLLRDDSDRLLHCYLFQAHKPTDVTDLYQQMKEQHHHQPPTRSASTAASLTSLCVDISPSSSTFFEVLYVGKIKVWTKRVPDSFIDDALEKFKAHENDKTKRKADKTKGDDNIRRSSTDSSASDTIEILTYPHMTRSASVMTGIGTARTTAHTIVDGGGGTTTDDSKESKLPAEIDDHNRTMVLQVDHTDLRLISPDRKVVLMHKHHRDVSNCVQGSKNAEYFGFICKEAPNTTTFIGYVFKCESAAISGDAVQAIRQAFTSAEVRPVRPTITSCEHCPMVWFHKLCSEVEHLTERKTQAAIFRKLEQLDEDEQNLILMKFKGAETDSIKDQNEFLMMLLRAHCEMKQIRHVHDTAENRSEFLNQYLGGSTIFMKAKRSLTNSFDLLKRRASKDDFSGKDMLLPVHSFNKESSPHSPGANSNADCSDKESEGTRSRSSTIGSQADLRENHLNVIENNKNSISPDRNIKSPMMDIFLKVGSSPKSNSDESSPKLEGSWRQAIFKRVVTPSKTEKEPEVGKKRSKEELRELWKKSINQAILLVRMEKENASLRAKQEENAIKRIKLEYDELRPQEREVMDMWDMVTNRDSRMKYDDQLFLQAIRGGIPRSKRGEVWMFLAEQFCKRTAPVDVQKYPNYNVPYETWLKQLTSHQHAILIDLGRTFPNHSYFASPLGPGQLALFNLLKAYSLLDPEVGYCQGLSFVAGVLLLHMEESQAFFLLRHLMFRRHLRKQYLPDMIGLQIKLYQLSRLVKDKLPELVNHFDYHDVSPTLYAAPWLLTIFASQFPLGFVTRVFDLIFLEDTDVIFRVALALLSYHKDNLLTCDGFEEIMNYLKVNVPAITKPVLDKIMKQVYTTDIRKQLNEYKVEYQVIREEMASVQPQLEALQKAESQNKTLTEQNKTLMNQLDVALSNVQRLEMTRSIQQSTINRLEMQNRAYEVTIATLGAFVNTLLETKVDVEIPDEVRRIAAQLSATERRRSENKTQNNLMKIFKKPDEQVGLRNPDKIMVKSLSTGRITVPSVAIDQNSLRSNSLKSQENESNNNSSRQKVSNFFSSSHSNILQKQQSCQNFHSNAKIDIKIQEFEAESEPTASPTNSEDSGVGTPSSPGYVHPLSNCDVNFTFNGTRELKTIKNLRNAAKNST